MMSPLKVESTHSVTRLVVLIGTVASLCFSAGEGIRLLPFANCGVGHGTSQVFRDGSVQAYAPSLHHGANGLIRLIKLKKSQRRDPNPYARSANYQAILLTPPTCHLSRLDQVSRSSVQPPRASLADRAPPLS